MNEPAISALVEAAETYESLFTPALFRQWAPVVAGSADLVPGQRVLDVACGTGTLARECLARVARSGTVCGVDPGRGMLAVARRLEPGIEWHEGVAEDLPFPDREFDAVVSQFGLMFFSDRDRALREMLRVLVAGGRLAVAVWNSPQSMPAYASAIRLFERSLGTRAADALRAPFMLGDARSLVKMFSGAGAVDVDVQTCRGTANFPSIRTMVEADLRGWLPVMGVEVTEEQIGRVLDQARVELRAFEIADGAARFDLSAHVVTARAAA